MRTKITYWLQWDLTPKKRKILTYVDGSRNHRLKDYEWSDVGQKYITILCDSNTFSSIAMVADHEGLNIQTDEQKWTHQIGQTLVKLARGGTAENPEGLGTQAIKLLYELVPDFTEEHPSTDRDFWTASQYWSFAPRFENIQTGVFENVYKIDIKSCYSNVMKDYPLPCGKPELITGSRLIQQKLREGQEGFISIVLNFPARIKEGQIPFVPNYHGNIQSTTKGQFFLFTRLLKQFLKRYKIRGEIYYKSFWTFPTRKGCLDHFLDYCQELRTNSDPAVSKRGKMLANCLYGYLGKGTFGGYQYRPIHLAVNHIAILKTYYLYHQFPKENVLSIRSDCIYVKGELPESIIKDQDQYHIEKYNKVKFWGKEDLYIYDTLDLKSRELRGVGREKVILKERNQA